MDVNVALDGIFQVQNVVKTDHVLQATLEAFPHMRPLHFAPANISHLIQSTTYHDLVMTFTEEHQANLTMRSDAMRTLIATYVIRDPSVRGESFGKITIEL
ncbi:unnamed protein product [Aphanomyces euteiches]